jgi:hypothetical protein
MRLQAFSSIAERLDATTTALGLVLRPLALAITDQPDSLGLRLPRVLPMDLSACRAAAPQVNEGCNH